MYAGRAANETHKFRTVECEFQYETVIHWCLSNKIDSVNTIKSQTSFVTGQNTFRTEQRVWMHAHTRSSSTHVDHASVVKPRRPRNTASATLLPRCHGMNERIIGTFSRIVWRCVGAIFLRCRHNHCLPHQIIIMHDGAAVWQLGVGFMHLTLCFKAVKFWLQSMPLHVLRCHRSFKTSILFL